MSDSSDIVDRDDSFIRTNGNSPEANAAPRSWNRRRSFLASPRATIENTFQDTQPFTEDDDLPVLTKVVALKTPVADQTPPQTSTQALDEAQVALLATEIVHAIGQQMSYELPSLIEATLLNASEELRAGITSTMESALRDYIAHRKQLPLPLDTPETRDNGTQEKAQRKSGISGNIRSSH